MRVNAETKARMIEKIAAAAGPLAGQDRRRARPLLQARDRRHPRVAGARRRRGPRAGGRRGARLRSGRDAGNAKAAPSPTCTTRSDAYDCAAGADFLVLATEWNEFRALDLPRLAGLLRSKTMIDLRNVYDPKEMRAAGWNYACVGPGMTDRKEHEPMRVLVTGGAGFLGSHLCDRLLREGHEVIAMDNLLTGNPRNIAHLEAEKRFRFVRHDVTQFIFVDGPLDAVLHFASPASPIDYLELPIQTLKVGSLGTHNALGLALAKKARFLLASTSEVYGDPLVHPQPETYWGNVNPIGPRGVYDEAKRFAEAITMAYHRVARRRHAHRPDLQHLRRADAAARRPRRAGAHRAGAGGRADDGLRRRLADPLVLLRLGPGRRHLPAAPVRRPRSDQHRQPGRALRARVRPDDPATLTGTRSEIVFKPLPVDDPKVRQPDITKAKEKLGWEPKVKLEEGLTRTIDYFRSL